MCYYLPRYSDNSVIMKLIVNKKISCSISYVLSLIEYVLIEVKKMTYMRPEMEIEKFDIIEEITADGASAAIGGDTAGDGNSSAALTDESIGGDLIIG